MYLYLHRTPVYLSRPNLSQFTRSIRGQVVDPWMSVRSIWQTLEDCSWGWRTTVAIPPSLCHVFRELRVIQRSLTVRNGLGDERKVSILFKVTPTVPLLPPSLDNYSEFSQFWVKTIDLKVPAQVCTPRTFPTVCRRLRWKRQHFQVFTLHRRHIFGHLSRRTWQWVRVSSGRSPWENRDECLMGGLYGLDDWGGSL